MKLKNDVCIEATIAQLKGVLKVCKGSAAVCVSAKHGEIALEELEKLIEPIKDKVWDRLIIVQVSPSKYIVAHPALADWEWQACTKPLDFSDAKMVMFEMTEKKRGEWSQLTVKNII